jgi:hypothetical protein
MRTYRKPIPASKYKRVWNDPRSVKVDTNGNVIKASNRSNAVLLDGFMYRRELSNANPYKAVYFRYRVKPVESYTIDYAYYEHRLLMEEHHLRMEEK